MNLSCIKKMTQLTIPPMNNKHEVQVSDWYKGITK